MASPSPADRTLILLSLLLLPFNLFSIFYRTHLRPTGRQARPIRPAILSGLLISLSTILVLSEVDPPPATRAFGILEDMKLRVVELESLLDEKTKVLNFKILQLEQSMKMTGEMDKKIESLQKIINDAKVSHVWFSSSVEKIKAIDNEVQQLWDDSRGNNINIHALESKTNAAEKVVEAIVSKVEKMESIVNEQWIQIQQLEQSLQLTKVMTSRVNKKSLSTPHRKSKFKECPVLKLRKGVSRYAHSEIVGLPDSFFLGGTISRSSLRKAMNQFQRLMLAAQNKHHELQYSVKQAMERNEYAAPLANKEVVFFVASAFAILPCMMAWFMYSAYFN
ncbi:hypothetical protein AXF42_Ash000234 [Apostasia shenzhenica]|uniref:Uncharacterized protein n=1 Tax=Apostasia shenzhenica TaxID=1088818 RepID=A0A2I0AFT8_9ASPA|nr:hypothetical protein AXF42_Ash000234 [Apostasia shenzhenica]